MLFVPGDRPERFDKAIRSGAEAICIDLEDAVAASQKATAREAALGFLRAPRVSTTFVCLRLNALSTADGLRDLLALAETSGADAVLLPKVESPDEVRLAAGICAGRQSWIPLIETAIGLSRVEDIARAAPDLAALMFGGADFSADVGTTFTAEALVYARQRIVCAAALARRPAIDSPFLDIADAAGLAQSARDALMLGFACKSAIHPSQIETIHSAFAPDAQEIARARRIVEAGAGGGAIRVDGRMVDGPVLEAARRVLARAGERSCA